jgi:1-deoxy-D-xylulose-5-phosphate reductoisomerase
MKTVTILGASGSIGSSALAFLRLHREAFSLESIALGRDWKAALQIAREFGCTTVALADPEAARRFRDESGGLACAVIDGPHAASAVAAMPVDVVLAAISGSIGYAPVLAAVRARNRVALANKEALVCGGRGLLDLARQLSTSIVPVDSEHSAILQCLAAGRPEEVRRIELTASGGPFRRWSREAMSQASVADALNHPVWPMGSKNSLDSATMANKGLELIETAYLFDIAPNSIDVLINPSSLLHSAVHYVDGSMIAMLGKADMRNAVGYGLTYPDRMVTGVDPLDLAEVGVLTFSRADNDRFPCIDLAREAVRQGQGAAMMFNAANEIAGRLFMCGAIGFLQIEQIITGCLASDTSRYAADVDDVVPADAAAKAFAEAYAGARFAAAEVD